MLENERYNRSLRYYAHLLQTEDDVKIGTKEAMLAEHYRTQESFERLDVTAETPLKEIPYIANSKQNVVF